MNTWGWGGGLRASPAWLSPLPDTRGVCWVPHSQLRDLLLPWCKAQPPSPLWEGDGFPLQGWLPTGRGWLCFRAARSRDGGRLRRASPILGRVLALARSWHTRGPHDVVQQCPVAGSRWQTWLSWCLPLRLLMAARKLCTRMCKGRMLVWTWLFFGPTSP